jgi:hypothetical protein
LLFHFSISKKVGVDTIHNREVYLFFLFFVHLKRDEITHTQAFSTNWGGFEQEGESRDGYQKELTK